MSHLPRYTGRPTNHAQVLLCIARDPGIRLRDIADRVGITGEFLALLPATELRPAADRPGATGRLASAA